MLPILILFLSAPVSSFDSKTIQRLPTATGRHLEGAGWGASQKIAWWNEAGGPTKDLLGLRCEQRGVRTTEAKLTHPLWDGKAALSTGCFMTLEAVKTILDKYEFI